MRKRKPLLSKRCILKYLANCIHSAREIKPFQSTSFVMSSFCHNSIPKALPLYTHVRFSLSQCFSNRREIVNTLQWACHSSQNKTQSSHQHAQTICLQFYEVFRTTHHNSILRFPHPNTYSICITILRCLQLISHVSLSRVSVNYLT